MGSFFTNTLLSMNVKEFELSDKENSTMLSPGNPVPPRNSNYVFQSLKKLATWMAENKDTIIHLSSATEICFLFVSSSFPHFLPTEKSFSGCLIARRQQRFFFTFYGVAFLGKNYSLANKIHDTDMVI
ncbi:1945_t:CDS:2 [Funneliformis geosporum]|nr:1945_t:CDS:2 [Funneliformis geosporum]